ncbi:hypothetical protein BD292_003859 [Rhodococcus percolatus]|nr:hypothetical protein [Rhodococcus opacus]
MTFSSFLLASARNSFVSPDRYRDTAGAGPPDPGSNGIDTAHAFDRRTSLRMPDDVGVWNATLLRQASTMRQRTRGPRHAAIAYLGEDAPLCCRGVQVTSSS